MKSIYLVDISSFIFRAYYAIRPLSTKEGVPVNAVYGVISMLNKLIEKHKPDHLIVCNDRPDKGFRHEIFPEYKANRDAPPEDLIPQFGLIKEYVKTYPIVAVDKKGYEADDVIATLVKQYKNEKDMQIFIVSSDKDLMQLVDDNVFLYDTMKNKIMKHDSVIEKFGVGPDKVVDVQSLCGDATDNIPGIKGVGPKTAAKLIQEYDTLEGVFENADKIKGKVGEKVRNGVEDARLSRKLVTLVGDVDFSLSWDEMELSPPDQEALNAFYKSLDFNRFVKDGGSSEATSAPKSQVNAEFELVNDLKRLEDIVKDIYQKGVKVLAFDTETTSIDSHQAELVGLSFCYDTKQAYYIPISHKEGVNIALSDVQKALGPLFADDKISKIAQNAKYDLNILNRHGIEVSPVLGDTLVADYLCDPSAQHNLNSLSQRFLNHDPIKFGDLVKKGQTFADVSLEQAAQYAAEDAWIVFSIYADLQKELKECQVEKIYNEVEIPLIPVLAKMEQHGVNIDTKLLDRLEEEFSTRLAALEKLIYNIAGEEFNINSPKQLSVILFEKLELPVIKKTKTGYSTDVGVLTELAEEHELPNKLLEYRSLAKLLNTYVVGLKNLVHKDTGRIHTNFNQAIVATGRLSSTDPNLQNIPIKTDEGKRIREVFLAPKNHILLSADYSQIELRLLADFSGDPGLMDAYKNNQDIHARTASHIFGMPIDEVDDHHRMIGKTINFGVIYGQSPFGLAKQLGVPIPEAKRFIDGFYEEFSRVAEYKEEILVEAREKGYVSTYLGRRRYMPDLNSKNKMVKQNAERVAFNTVFQGSAADLIKTAMVSIDQKITEMKLATKMILQVHDELIFEVPSEERDAIKSFVPEMMENAFKLKIPLKVSFGEGKDWREAH
jgi:DNA polymerase I